MIPPPLRIITVKHPWCGAIWALADRPDAKDVENRSAGFPSKYSGLVGFHAGQGWSKHGAEDERVVDLFSSMADVLTPDLEIDDGRSLGGVRRIVDPERRPPSRIGETFPRGCVEAVGEVVDVHPAGPGCCESRWAESSYVEAGGRLRTEIVHLRIEDVRRVDPLFLRGKLGLWTPPADDAAKLIEAYEAAGLTDAVRS